MHPKVTKEDLWMLYLFQQIDKSNKAKKLSPKPCRTLLKYYFIHPTLIDHVDKEYPFYKNDVVEFA